MKQAALNYNQLTLCAVAIIITCWNGSMVDTSNKGKRPDTNFYGTLQDHQSTSKVEDILIGKKYEQIPFYSKIDSAKLALDKQQGSSVQIDPTKNKVLLDLHEISEINLKYPDRPIEHEIDINGRKYSEVKVTAITGSENEYLVESNREISCLKIDKGPNNDQPAIQEERKLNMIHVKNLTIKGYKSATDSKKTESSSDKESKDSYQVKQSTEKILDQIEEKVNNLPKEDPSNYEKVKHSLLSLLRSLRDQLQKLLGMIKS